MPTSKAVAPARPRPVLTGRALVLGALVVLLIVVLAAPVNRYLASRRDVASAASQLHADRAQRGSLTEQEARYRDPGFIAAQARSRLGFALPGDTVYTAVRAGQQSLIERTSGPSRAEVRAGTSWNTRLWGSVRSADRA